MSFILTNFSSLSHKLLFRVWWKWQGHHTNCNASQTIKRIFFSALHTTHKNKYNNNLVQWISKIMCFYIRCHLFECIFAHLNLYQLTSIVVNVLWTFIFLENQIQPYYYYYCTMFSFFHVHWNEWNGKYPCFSSMLLLFNANYLLLSFFSV